MTDGNARVYRVKSCEGHVFVVDEAVASQSGYISCRAEADVVVIPQGIVDTKTLEKVLEWCEKHTPAHKAAVPPDVLRKWEDEFADSVPKGILFAARYLEITELVYRLCARQAQLQIAALRKWEEDMMKQSKLKTHEKDTTSSSSDEDASSSMGPWINLG